MHFTVRLLNYGRLSRTNKKAYVSVSNWNFVFFSHHFQGSLFVVLHTNKKLSRDKTASLEE